MNTAARRTHHPNSAALINKLGITDASAASLAGNNEYLEALFQKIIETNSKRMQEMWIRKILRK